MNNEVAPLMVPRLLDEPPKFLFWDFEVALAALGLMLIGILAGFFFTGTAIGFVAAYGVQRLKSGQSRGYSLHLIYWHLPINSFKRTPPSCVREFVG
jgi:conjugal transfer pilus assembly protein TraL